MPYLKNTWYIAALSTEVDGTALFERKILGESILIYRKQDGQAVALRNRCPHRFAPLILGSRQGDDIVCLYHALRFDCSGNCTHNPHGNGHIPQAAKVKSYPLIERYGFLWIWMGDQSADASRLPDYRALDDGPPSGVGHAYMYMKANYQLIIDNVMDLSHLDHVHAQTFLTRGNLSPLVPQVQETASSVAARWEWTQAPPIRALADFLPDPTGAAHHFFTVNWMPPANIQLSFGGTQNDVPLAQWWHDGVGAYDLHAVTPETETTTHYFFATRRNHVVDDEAFNQFKIQAMKEAFEREDGPVLHGMEEQMGGEDFFALNPVLMSNDVASVKVRRLLQKMIASEAAQAAQTVCKPAFAD